MTDTTQGATAASNPIQQINATLSADWQKVTAFFQEAEAWAADFLGKVATGAQVFIADIEGAASYVAGNLTSIQAGITAAGTLATIVAPNNATVTKAVADLQTAAQDVADLHASLTSGASASDPQIVTTAVTAINSVNQLSVIASNVSQMLGTIAANSPTATQGVSS